MTGINKIICEKSKLCILGLVRRLYILGLVRIEILLSIFNVSFSSEVLEEITFIGTSFETTLEMSKNFKSSSARFFEPRIHVERTGSVLLAQICAMTLATFICLSFLPLRISCHNRGSGFCSIRYLVPFTKNFYNNYKTSACNPLYPKLHRTIRRKSHRYRETRKKLNHEIYHC